jgi:hypothetical protein
VGHDDLAADRFAGVVDELTGVAGVTPPRAGSGFGRQALRFQGKIFAMFVRGQLVLKLPAEPRPAADRRVRARRFTWRRSLGHGNHVMMAR